ncbi:unnamed protein product [Closterium sp. NIES-54]
MYITLYFIVTRLPGSLCAVRDHFLTLDPTDLTVGLLEQHLLAPETSVVAVGAARGTPRMPFFEGCSPSTLAPSYAVAAAVDVLGAEDVGAASASGKHDSSKGKGGRGGGGGSGGGGGGNSGGGGGGGGGGRVGRLGTCGKPHTQHCYFSRLDDAWRGEFGDEVECPHWAKLLRSGVAIFDLDYDAILSAMYALSASAEGDCYQCVPPDRDIEATALGASEYFLPSTAPAEALHTFMLDSGASRCFFHDSTTSPGQTGQPLWGLGCCPFLHCPPVSGVSVRLTVTSSPPLILYELGEYNCPPGRDGHYHHSWGSACVDLHVYTDGSLPGNVHSLARVESVHAGYRAPSGSCVCSGVRVRSRSTPLLVSPPVAPDSSVAPPPGSPLPATPSWHALLSSFLWSSQVSASPTALACPTLPSLHQGAAARRSSLLLTPPVPVNLADPSGGPIVACSSTLLPCPAVAPPCSCCLLSHQTLLWHHCLPRLRGMHSRLLVSGLPRSLPPLPPSPAPPCLPCIEGRQRAAPHSSFPPTTAPLRTLHMDVWGPARVSGQGRERYFLLVVHDYTRNTTVFPLRSKGQVVDVLIPWTRAVRHQSASGFAWTFLSYVCTLTEVDDTFDESFPFYLGVLSLGVRSLGVLSLRVLSLGGVEPGGEEPWGAEPEGVELGGAETESAESGGVEPWGAAPSGGPAGALPSLSPRPETLSP